MNQRLSVPIRALLHIGAVTVAAIATARDFHLASFISGAVIAIALSDAYRFFNSTKGHTP